MLQFKSVQTTTDFLLPRLSSNIQAAMVGIFSFRHINPSYLGPVVNLRNGDTNETKDFYASPTGELRGDLFITSTVTPESWLRTNVGTTTGYITTWYDQSGYGMHATRTVTSNQPYLRRTPYGYAATFTMQSKTALFYGTTTTWSTSNYTFIARERRGNNSSNYFLGTALNATNAGLSIGYRTETTITHAQINNGYDFSLSQLFPYDSNLEFVRRWTVTHHNSLTPGKQLYINGLFFASSNNNVPLILNHGQPVIGCGFDSNTTNYQGDIYDIFMMNNSIHALDDAAKTNLLLIDNYLERANDGRPSLRRAGDTSLGLEITSNTVGVYSLRQVNPGYAGPIIQLRHGSTGEIRDFYGNTNGNILVDASSNTFQSWITTATAFVPTWYDQSGRGMNATQTTQVNQPSLSYNTRAASYYLAFNGTTFLNYSTSNAASILNTSNYTFIIKERRTSTKAINYLTGTLSSTSNLGLHLGYRFQYSLTHAHFNNDYDTPVPYFKGDSEPIRSLAWSFSKTALPGRWTFIDGKLVNSYANSVPLTTAQPMIGRAIVNASAYYQGEIYEFLLYNEALNTLPGGTTRIANIALRHKQPPTRPAPPSAVIKAPLDTRSSAGIPTSLLQQSIGIYSTRKLLPTYKGPILRLSRDSDSIQADVFANNDGVVTRVVPHNLDDNATYGGVITYDGAYKIHTFTSAGTFTTSTPRDIEVLVVGGGGGGGSSTAVNQSCGGGGGGGEVIWTTLNLPISSVSIEVGQGGAANANGNPSKFGNQLIAQGGGAGGSFAISSNGQTGGSGGGGARGSLGGDSIRYKGLGSPGGSTTPTNGGGGGGAGNTAAPTGSNGTQGFYTKITGTWDYYGSGGGGGRNALAGVNGVGGSNAGNGGSNITAAIANRGGGGGGAQSFTTTALTGGAGGSGIVVIRTLRHPGFLGSNAVSDWLQASPGTVTVWFDQTSNQNHGTSNRGNPRYDPATSSIIGNTLAGIGFPSNILPPVYTLFHTAKYNGSTRGRIFNGLTNWLSGHHANKSGVAFHGSWITNNTTDIFGDALVVSTDQNTPDLYRANLRTDLTIASNNTTAPALRINAGYNITTNTLNAEPSEWLVRDTLVFPRTLNIKEIETVETSLYRRILGPLDRVYPATKLTSALCYSTLLATNTYTGPMLRLKNNRTNVEQDFYGNFHGDLGTLTLARGTPLSQWLFPDPLSNTLVTQIYDQSGNGRHLSNLTTVQLYQNSNSTDRVYYFRSTSNIASPLLYTYTTNDPYHHEITFRVPAAQAPAAASHLFGAVTSSNAAQMRVLPTGLIEIRETNDAGTSIAGSNATSIFRDRWSHAVRSTTSTEQSLVLNGTTVISGRGRPTGTLTASPISLGTFEFVAARVYNGVGLSNVEITNLSKTRGL